MVTVAHTYNQQLLRLTHIACIDKSLMYNEPESGTEFIQLCKAMSRRHEIWVKNDLIPLQFDRRYHDSDVEAPDKFQIDAIIVKPNIVTCFENSWDIAVTRLSA